MKTTRIVVVAAVIVASGLVLARDASAAAGIKRIDLQRYDLSVPGREVVQVIVELEARSDVHPGTRIQAKRSSTFSKGRRSSTRSKERRR